MGLGVVASGARRFTGPMILAAARAPAENSPALKDPSASLLPPLSGLRRVAADIAAAVGREAQKEDIAIDELARSETLMGHTNTNQFRIEEDALGSVRVPTERLWGARTQRSHLNFPIGFGRFHWGPAGDPRLGILKKRVALANGELG